jgi:hypothetical protein
MSTEWQIVLAILAGLPAFLTALATFIKQILDAQATSKTLAAQDLAAANTKQALADKIEVVHQTINSRMSEMLANTKEAGIAQGIKQEQDNPEKKGP